MANQWTIDQEAAIDHRGKHLLVAAAAGSGKTAVLVERVIRRITDPVDPVDVDRILVVTFTRAAAAEMRERIRIALEKKRMESPENEARLQRQLALLNRAKITTIDSFCLEIVRQNYHRLDLDPSFRMADESELVLLSEDVLDALFEENYALVSGGGIYVSSWSKVNINNCTVQNNTSGTGGGIHVLSTSTVYIIWSLRIEVMSFIFAYFHVSIPLTDMRIYKWSGRKYSADRYADL